MSPTLLNLPHELRAIITSYLVQARDLNSLCLCCKTLKATTSPCLYETVELKVPLKWNRLTALENLLSSTNEGLRFTRRLEITPQQSPIPDDQYGSREGLDLTDDEGDEEERSEEDDTAFKLYTPGRWASSALNALIRPLILRIPRQQLCSFQWKHECRLASQTFAVLLDCHRESLRFLGFRRHTLTWRESNLAALLKMQNLTTLKFLGLDSEAGEWPLNLLVSNRETLKHIELGNEPLMAEMYSDSGQIDDVRSNEARELVLLLKQRLPTFDETSNPPLCPETLLLCGIDFYIIGPGSSQPIFEFSNLSVLVLESCAGLIEALPMLIQTRSEQKDSGALRLRTFKIRHEGISDALTQALETFLSSLRPLTTLHVLLEGGPLRPILKTIIKDSWQDLKVSYLGRATATKDNYDSRPIL